MWSGHSFTLWPELPVLNIGLCRRYGRPSILVREWLRNKSAQQMICSYPRAWRWGHIWKTEKYCNLYLLTFQHCTFLEYDINMRSCPQKFPIRQSHSLYHTQALSYKLTKQCLVKVQEKVKEDTHHNGIKLYDVSPKLKSIIYNFKDRRNHYWCFTDNKSFIIPLINKTPEIILQFFCQNHELCCIIINKTGTFFNLAKSTSSLIECLDFFGRCTAM